MYHIISYHITSRTVLRGKYGPQWWEFACYMAQTQDGHFVRRFSEAKLYGLKTRGTKLTWENYLFTYLLTPWCRVLLEKLTGLQLAKKFPEFYGTRRFITALTSVRHLSLSWANPIQSIYPHPTSCISVLILSTHLRLGLTSGLFLSCFPTKTSYTPLSSPIHATCPAHLMWEKYTMGKFMIYILQ